MTDADPASGRPRVLAADSDDLDMTGVDPLRLGEVRRRVAVVRSFVALANPTDADRASHAESIGLSVNQFLALVRAWKEHGRAVAISGAGAAKGTPRPKGARNLPAASKAAAAAVIATVGPEVSLVETVRLVRERCGALRVAAPSRNTIWNMLMAHRRARGTAGPDGTIVCKCHVRLPVEAGGSVEFLEIALAVDMPTGVILAGAIAGDASTAAALASGLRRRTSDGPILVDADLAVSIRSNAPLLSVKATAARTATAKVLGRGFGTLDLIYQRSRTIRPAHLLRSRKDAALTLGDARQIVAAEIAAHNAARGAEPPILSWET